MAALAALFLSSAAPAPARVAEKVLRVCADPNNLPFSNDRRQGFENRLAALAARDLGLELEYTWWAQRRGFLRNTLKAGRCDVVMGLPARLEGVATTRPYYESRYVFVTRGDAAFAPRSFDDPALRTARIGVQLVGDDYVNTPPVEALARRGIVDRVVGYSVLGDYSEPDPPARIVRAVAAGEIDVAAVWGPLAGYFALRSPRPLRITPVPEERDPALAMSFAIAIGVRRGDTERRRRLDSFLERRAPEIARLLDRYGVPRR